jgi:prolipoprotein diacylglyceryltransferase
MAMSARASSLAPTPGYPRYFWVAGHWVNSYKVFLCIGVYLGILLSAAVAAGRGLSPLRVGAGLLLSALGGMIGARIYNVAVNLHQYREAGLRAAVWDSGRGGWSVFGGVVIFPLSLVVAPSLGLPVAVFWDYLALAIVVGGAFIRFGCICNGCCVGRASDGWLALRQHDTEGVYRRRIPVQWLEIAWWLLAGIGLIWLWPRRFTPGSYALGVLGWYGLGRFWLEPLRERSDVLYGHLRVDRLVAALLVIVAGSGLLQLFLRSR